MSVRQACRHKGSILYINVDADSYVDAVQSCVRFEPSPPPEYPEYGSLTKLITRTDQIFGAIGTLLFFVFPLIITDFDELGSRQVLSY